MLLLAEGTKKSVVLQVVWENNFKLVSEGKLVQWFSFIATKGVLPTPATSNDQVTKIIINTVK